MFRALFLISVLVALAIVGCTYHTITGTEISDTDAAWIQDSVTTKADLLLQFGEPTKTVIIDSNRIAFFFSWSKGSTFRGTPFFHLGASSKSEAQSLIVICEDDLVIAHKITRGDAADASSFIM